jgi:hypothetical protein
LKIAQGGLDTIVAEEALDGMQVSAGFQEMRRKRMPARFDIMLYLMDNGTASRC